MGNDWCRVRSDNRNRQQLTGAYVVGRMSLGPHAGGVVLVVLLRIEVGHHGLHWLPENESPWGVREGLSQANIRSSSVSRDHRHQLCDHSL